MRKIYQNFYVTSFFNFIQKAIIFSIPARKSGAYYETDIKNTFFLNLVSACVFFKKWPFLKQGLGFTRCTIPKKIMIEPPRAAQNIKAKLRAPIWPNLDVSSNIFQPCMRQVVLSFSIAPKGISFAHV
jgi:hypothetical protein